MKMVQLEKVNNELCQRLIWIVIVSLVILSTFARLPFAVQDEEQHYSKVLQIESGHILPQDFSNDGSQKGVYIDSSQKALINNYTSGNLGQAISFDWMFHLRSSYSHTGVSEIYINTPVAPYTPVPYLPYLPGALIAKWCNFSIPAELIAMRISGALILLMILYATFRIAPYRRWSIIAIAALPMTITELGAISADGFTIAICTLFTTLIVKMLFSEATDTKTAMLIFLSAILLTTSKIPSFLLVSLILLPLIIKRNTMPKKIRLILVCTIVICAAITVIWAKYCVSINTGAYWGRATETTKQLLFILHNPHIFAANLIYSMINYAPSAIAYNTYGNNRFLGSFPFMVSMVIIVVLLLSVFLRSKNEKSVNKDMRIAYSFFGLFFVVTSCIFTLLYLQFTPVGQRMGIEGVQGRYFIPYLPLILLAPIYTRELSATNTIRLRGMQFFGVVMFSGLLFSQLIFFR